MTLLLDTHVLLWYILADPRLTPDTRRLIQDETNSCWLSIASVWEIAIKSSLGSLKLGMSMSRLVDDHVLANRINLLPINSDHLDELAHLPFHHRDPFDRLIIAQAIVESFTLVSRDGSFGNYPVTCIWR